MLQFDILGLIPKHLQQQALDTLVDFVSGQAKKYASDELAAKIKQLRSDAAFNRAFQEGLERAAQRFIQEYETEDEDLVAAITAEEDFFKNEQVQAALLAILKKPGIYLADERDEMAESFTSVLPERKNRERVDRAVTYLLKCLAEELWHLPELQPIYSLQFQRMTAEATRQQVELQKAQLAALTSLNVGVREALLQLTDAIAERKLLPSGEAPALPTPPSKPKVYHNLPQPDYGRFVGREGELAQVVRILRPYPHSQHALVTIDGIGGIGKSALALEVAHRYLRNYERIPPEERFEAIIWTSAKGSVLTAEGIVPRSQALRTLDDIYATIAVALQREDITRARKEEQAEVMRNALIRQRTLLVVDNLETVDDKAVMTFLHELPAPTKAIVTTRHRIDVAYPVRLVGMSWRDAWALISQECDKKGVTLSEDEAHLLYDRTGGVPLAIVWSIAQMGFGYDVKTVLTRLGQPTSDIARFCFEGAVEGIRSKPAHKLLMALSLFATDASREALGCVADLSELDHDDGLVTLEKLSLVNKNGNRFQALPLTLVYCKDGLAEDDKLENQLRIRWVNFLLNFLSERGQNRYDDLENTKHEINNILSAMDWCWQTNRLAKFIAFARRMDFYLWVTGNWSAWNRYMEIGLKAAVSLKEELAEAQFLDLLARMRYFQGYLDEAQGLIEKAINICRLHNDVDGLGRSIWGLASIQIERGEYVTARRNLDEALEMAARLEDEKRQRRLIVRIQRHLAVIDMAEGNYESAGLRLTEARKLREEDTQLSSGLSYTYRLLGELSVLKGDFELGRQYFQRSLEIGRRVGNQQDIAGAKQAIAELELRLGNADTAKELTQEAVDVFVKLGMQRAVGEAQELLERIREAEAQHPSS
jgi:tetratricopeptide (TPR) repeat protein